MLTWKIWTALRHPQRTDPLLRLNLSQRREFPIQVNGVLFLWLFSCSGLGFCWSIAFNWMPLIVLMGLIFANTGISLLLAVNVGSSIAREKETNRFDLVGVLPNGAFGASWAMSLAKLYGSRRFTWTHFIIRLFFSILFLTLLCALLITLFVLRSDLNPNLNAASASNQQLLFTLVYAFTFVVIFYTDHIQSVVSAVLTGILIAATGRTQGEVRIRVAGIFLAGQVIIYALTALLAFTVLPVFLRFFGPFSVWSAIIVGFVTTLFFYALRELTIRALWSQTIYWLNVDQIEKNFFAAKA